MYYLLKLVTRLLGKSVYCQNATSLTCDFGLNMQFKYLSIEIKVY